jgi:ferric-dicitrate binding protein FerR (iron transport regulator)
MNERHELSDESVERLLRIASEKPAVPHDAETRVRAAVHQAWQQDVAKRRFRRRVWTASSLAAAAAIAVVFFFVPRRTITTTPLPAAKLERSIGTVHVHAADGGTLIETGADGRASFRLDSGTEFRIDRNSRVSVGREFTVITGALYVASAERGLAVRTRFGVARDIGTRFEVRVEGDTELVRVRDGIVDFETHRAIAGEQLEIKQGGVTKSALATHAAEWSWTESVAPMFTIEGSSVSSFVAWVASESGMQVQYESNALRLRAQQTTLHGSIGELTPAVACGAILPTAGMRCTATNGVLKIDGAR